MPPKKRRMKKKMATYDVEEDREFDANRPEETLTVDIVVRATEGNKNVLFIIADDLRPQLGSYFGNKDFPDPTALKPVTPHLDQLAAKSLLLKRAYVQAGVCGPSRASFMTGRRPETTRMFENGLWTRTHERNLTTIPQYFKEHGYRTFGMGKIFQESGTVVDYESISWTEPYLEVKLDDHTDDTWWEMTEKDRKDTSPHDDIVLDHAIETLKNISQHKQDVSAPFFMAVGFWKPHLKFACPKKFFRYYPLKNITLPKNQFFPPDMPKYEWDTCARIKSDQIKQKMGFGVRLVDQDVLSLRRAYYACVSYVDHLVGKLLQTLQDLHLQSNTVVSFIGDHGFLLGENNMWCKRNNLELVMHAPMMIHIPGVTDKGIITKKLVEFVDLFPTLVEAAGLPLLQLCPETNQTHPDPVPTCREGTSLMPLVQKPNIKRWKKFAFSQQPARGKGAMGYSVKNGRYRYVEWFKLNENIPEKNFRKSLAVELYDSKENPDQNINFAHHKDYSQIANKLGEVLRGGWRKAFKLK